MTDQPDHLRIPARPSGDPNDVTNGQSSVIDAPVDTQLDTTPVDLDADTPNREAAKYRTRLRTLESENSTLTLQVAALQRAQISAQVADAGLRPDAVFKTSELETMLDPETGAVDPGRVAAAIKFARSSLGIEVHGGLRGLPEGPNPTTRGGDAFTGAFTPPAEPRRR
jgi:hypothetical protein